ncbi:YbhB/YbcL family Raf kinase inhibitor-like protein [Telmatospirillum sp. J64-1]|uniref:YbhB/YbcL family Raf kinase inhibitor-like protein n=1 Tax=Telmatospirillum sp. J64-1 TaxID=2502183 RepID=UPI00115E21C2|nr:YbhB/YbcL family Raf kinase inhibitor-like protein [Telmatospirillum sp. J64-1]
MPFALSSPALKANERMPEQYSCDGADISPPLEFIDPPPGTRSFAIICVDPDAPNGPFYHWGVFDIPGDATGLREQFLRTERGASHQAINDFEAKGYGGPCPPKGGGEHHYRFRLYALKVESLPVREPISCRDLEKLAEEHCLAATDLICTYSR